MRSKYLLAIPSIFSLFVLWSKRLWHLLHTVIMFFSTPSPPLDLGIICASGNAKGEPQKIHILPSLSHTVSLTDLRISVAWLRFDLYKTYTFWLWLFGLRICLWLNRCLFDNICRLLNWSFIQFHIHIHFFL